MGGIIGTRPDISNSGASINAIGKRPEVAHGGRGIHAHGKIPEVSKTGNGIHGIGTRSNSGNPTASVTDAYNTNLYEWFRVLSARLRYVRVVCGDWSRVCGGNWQHRIGRCGMFFDPPYPSKDRASVYSEDSYEVGDIAAQWAVKRGRNPSYRIVFAGYEGEHQILLDAGWKAVPWKANGGYGNQGDNNENRHRETLFVSPHCEEAC
jgi:hypothetical protein